VLASVAAAAIAARARGLKTWRIGVSSNLHVERAGVPGPFYPPRR
jgi:hypothetical protein